MSFFRQNTQTIWWACTSQSPRGICRKRTVQAVCDLRKERKEEMAMLQNQLQYFKAGSAEALSAAYQTIDATISTTQAALHSQTWTAFARSTSLEAYFAGGFAAPCCPSSRSRNRPSSARKSCAAAQSAAGAISPAPAGQNIARPAPRTFTVSRRRNPPANGGRV